MTGADALVITLFAAPLLVAAAWDLVTFRIPNTLNLLFLALFAPAVLLAPHSPDWPWHLAAFGLVLAVGLVLFVLRLLGGGDVKLMTVTALWLGWDRLLEFTLLVALCGGMLAVALLILRSPRLQPVYVHVGGAPKVLEPKAAIPYGIAIAVAGLLMARQLPLLVG